MSAASRLIRPSAFSTSLRFSTLPRAFHTTAPRFDIAPVRKPVGAFRGGILGFLLGSTLAGAGVYGYILQEYRVSNQLLSEDIYALQAAVHRIEAYTKSLEVQVAKTMKK